MPAGELAALLLTLSAILLRGVFAAAETALATLGRSDAEEMVEAGGFGSEAVVRLKAYGEEVILSLRAIQVTLLALAAGLAGYAAVLMRRRLPSSTPQGPDEAAFAVVAGLAAVAVALLVFFFGDLLPRAVAVGNPRGTARRLAPAVLIVRLVTLPGVRLWAWVSDGILARFGYDLRRVRPPPPLEDLERYLADHAARGDVEGGTPELIHSIFEFTETTAKEVMVPRTEVVALEVGASTEEVLQTLSESGHTRLPVYRDDIDEVVGIINSKDIVPLVERGERIELLPLLRPVTHVPWSRPIQSVMREFQARHIHMAVVVDEYGGVMGLVTLEDILEEIVGEIEDEFDTPETDIQGLADGSFLIAGRMEIEEFNDRFGADIPYSEHYESIGGFVNSLAGAIPEVGETYVHGDLQFVISHRGPRRVERVRVRRVRRPHGEESA